MSTIHITAVNSCRRIPEGKAIIDKTDDDRYDILLPMVIMETSFLPLDRRTIAVYRIPIGDIEFRADHGNLPIEGHSLEFHEAPTGEKLANLTCELLNSTYVDINLSLEDVRNLGYTVLSCVIGVPCSVFNDFRGSSFYHERRVLHKCA